MALYRRQGLRLSPRKGNAKSKMASKEAFKIAVKRREVKQKKKDIPTFEYRIPKNSKEG